MILLGKGAQRLREDRHPGGVDRELAARRAPNQTLDADQIADVEQPHDADRLGTRQVPMGKNLDLARGIVQIDEHAAVAHRADAAGDANVLFGLGAGGEIGVALIEIGRSLAIRGAGTSHRPAWRITPKT